MKSLHDCLSDVKYSTYNYLHNFTFIEIFHKRDVIIPWAAYRNFNRFTFDQLYRDIK